ncbi:MAG TPA: hypothetical protein VGB42_06405 [Candidatus Thermoplasmatota archaeon]
MAASQVGGLIPIYSKVVCTECPWRLRHEYPQPMGLVCRYHIERFDGAPAADVIAGFLRSHGFREDALAWLPSKAVLRALQEIRSRMR